MVPECAYTQTHTPIEMGGDRGRTQHLNSGRGLPLPSQSAPWEQWGQGIPSGMLAAGSCRVLLALWLVQPHLQGPAGQGSVQSSAPGTE